MGLGAPKKRTKLSHDPNNTNWSKSTSNFGHRILSKQGWSPGSFLGAKNAAHADHYTAANASHIRVLLREDNLGLGATVGGNGRAETFGLATLSGIFGRLNGKSDEDVQKHQGALRDAELRTWHAGKHGHMNFIRGGFLVGDEVKQTLDEVKPLADTTTEKSKKKRKLDEADKATETSTEQKTEEGASSSTRSEKKSKKRKAEPAAEDDTAALESKSTSKDGQSSDSSADSSSDDRAARKAEKRARKEERRKRKEAKRLRKAEKEAVKSTSTSNTPTVLSTGTTPLSTGASTPQFAGSRHAVRHRYIQQKRMASLNPQALKEILMMKAQG